MSLFDEAVADAKKLRELAEHNAKNKILESITPKIRRIIEQELVDDEVALTMDDVLVEPEEEEEDLESSKFDIDVQGDATITFSSGDDSGNLAAEEEYEEEEEDDVLTLNQESARALGMIIKNPPALNRNYFVGTQAKIRKLDRTLNLLEGRRMDPSLRESVRKSYIQLVKEVKRLRKDAIFNKRADIKNEIRLRFNKILKEFKTMSRRHAETLFDKLFEKKGYMRELDVVLADEDLETLGVEEPEEANVEDLDVTVSFAGEEEEEEVDVEVGEEEEVDLGELDLVLSDEDFDVLGVEDTEDVDVSGLDVSVEFEGGEEEEETEEEVEMEEVYEIDESVLRRELRRMRRIREQEEAADADPFLDHGGEDLGDVIVDVDAEDLLNALADELGDPDVATPTVESRRRRRSRRQVAERKRRSARRPRISESRAKKAYVNESRKNRALSRRLVEARKVVSVMKNQLNEMNLFNAKLLYVNKLMQNRNLSTKQQKAIVEALDNAKTLREAKLLYKSLTASLNRRGGTLTEGKIARTLGSSSRSTRSASPSKSGTEVDRWAVLAGINQDK